MKRKEEINVLDLSNFVLSAAKLLSDNKPENVQVKTTLHSPGEVILQVLNSIQVDPWTLVICYLIIFGGKCGSYEFNSLLGFAKDLIKYLHEKERVGLELRKLAAETDLIEQEVLGQKLDNIKKLEELRLETIDECAEPLVNASKNLEVEPDTATLIDITELLKRKQEENL